MKKMALAGLVSLLILSGAALAQQSGEQKKSSSMEGMMEQMMKGEKGGEGGMGGMMGMMGMMKMMEQCGAMMESMRAPSGQTKKEEKK
ncbi:MAG: hypothetical protein HYU47_00865 [Deltaproteobacteria bacterium]|nr:hypothetical protein [Deltaproteobacteria bacterium]